MEGDHILCEVAGILQDSFREGDIVGRPGGDEFIIYMERIRDTRTLGDKCERLLQRISEIRMPDKKSLTISLGAVLARPQNDYDSLYIKADKALYRAKRKDAIRILSPEPPYFSEHFNLKKQNTKKV